MTALPQRQKVIPCLWFDKQAEEGLDIAELKRAPRG